MTDKSTWAKDFGMYMYEQTKNNVNPPVYQWNRFTFWSLAMIETDLFSTTINTEVDSEPYAVTADFDRRIFDAMLDVIPAKQAERLRKFATQSKSLPAMLHFREDPIKVIARLKLGKLTHGDGEDFIPFIMIDVSQPEE